MKKTLQLVKEKLQHIHKTLSTPLPKKEAKEFHEGVTKPLFAVAFGICIFAVLMDYSMQLVDAIDILIQ